ncbi:MAG: primosomal protein N' [Deltaproteobacteria bacterium]|nr:primosomal protein N' [Deltaproteobacteria bacterium]
MAASGKYALVAVPAPLDEPLTYAVPEALRGRLDVGMRVLVPLGRRRVTGVVVGFERESPVTGVKEVAEALDDEALLDPAFLKLCRWAADYYVAPLGEVLAAALPPLLRAESRLVVTFAHEPDGLQGTLDREVLDAVRSRGPLTPAALSRRFPRRGVKAVVDRLAAAGAVVLEDRLRGHVREARRRRQPRPETTAGAQSGRAPVLTEEQQEVLRSIDPRLEQGGFETMLLHGVTGSGKTEVYLRAMEQVRRRGRQSLILVPEIALTPQLLDRLEARFPGDVAVLHSGLTAAERWRHWWRIAHGAVKVVAGARSAVFAPVRELGLIVVDEEHDTSYKQEEGVRYHGRDLAVVRGRIVGCPVILGSATPSVESYHNARGGRYRMLELTERVEARPMPRVEIVDLKTRPGQSSADGLFSAPLLSALRENHERGRQSLIFLNRRGFASFLQCWSCGFVFRCPRCSISLTYHLGRDSTFCHHCGFRQRKADACPECGNLSLSEVGFGTERVEHELRRLLPKARIGRMDRDTTSARGAQERIFRAWEKGDLDVLVGTQMIAKGHDVGGVTLVGVVLADSSLNIPDFRAAERTFQIISQVAGRAGRAREPGRVIVQTLVPGHYCFEPARAHDYPTFFATETGFRREVGYPPFQHLVHLRLDGTHEDKVARGARDLARALRREKPKAPLEILGPAPAPIARLRSRYRWQILLKGRSRPALLALARRAAALVPRGRVFRIHVDVDPHNML